MFMQITMTNIHTGEIYFSDAVGIVEKLDMRKSRHRDGWVSEASVISGQETGVRWLQAHGKSIHDWTIEAQLLEKEEK